MGKTDRTLGEDDKAADMVPALALAVLMAPVEVSVVGSMMVWAEVPVVLEEDRALAPAEVPVALAADRVTAPAEVLEVPVVLEEDRAEVPVALVEDKEVDREVFPVFAAYRTDNTENKAVDMVPALDEVLEASVEGLACVYDHRSRPA